MAPYFLGAEAWWEHGKALPSNLGKESWWQLRKITKNGQNNRPTPGPFPGDPAPRERKQHVLQNSPDGLGI